jgi:hypothetical protein
MKSVLDKRGNIAEVPGYFQIFLLVAIFAGLTFIVLDKFLDVTNNTLQTTSVVNESGGFINATGYQLAEYAANRTLSNVVVIDTDDSSVVSSNMYTINDTWYIFNATETGLTQINISYDYSTGEGSVAYDAINQSTQDLYDYGIGFLGIIILVTMVYLIIRIVSGSSDRK